MEKISFLSQGQRIDGTLFLPETKAGKSPAVLFFHGLTSSENRYHEFAQLLCANGIIGITLSMRGHGTSKGDPSKLTIRDIIEDGLTAYDFLVGHEDVDASRIGICGSSLGGAVGAIVSGSREVKSLLLRAPAIYSKKMMKMTFNQIMADEANIFHNIDDFEDTLEMWAISKYSGSLFVVTSELDAILPAWLTDQYKHHAYHVSKLETLVMKGVPHPLDGDKNREDFSKIMLQWFKETL